MLITHFFPHFQIEISRYYCGFPHFPHFWFQKCGRYYRCLVRIIINLCLISTNKDSKYFLTYVRPKSFWKTWKVWKLHFVLIFQWFTSFKSSTFSTLLKKKFILCGFLIPFSTLLPLNFVKSTQKNFANVILCGFLIPSSTLLVCKKCGNFMIWPHSCHNMRQCVSTTPISTS